MYAYMFRVIPVTAVCMLPVCPPEPIRQKDMKLLSDVDLVFNDF
jgi:hypothetical protein